ILIITYMWYSKENQSDIDFELGRSISTLKIFFILIDTGMRNTHCSHYKVDQTWWIFFKISTVATIISDGWAAYMNISLIPGYRYTHLSVNHSLNYVGSSTGAHTNSVEGNWRWARAFMPVTGTRKSLIIAHTFLSIHIEIYFWQVVNHAVLTYLFQTSGKYIIPTPLCPYTICLI
ncbi:hypothetical protein HZS_2133, partial [Henneguya salminicola]